MKKTTICPVCWQKILVEGLQEHPFCSSQMCVEGLKAAKGVSAFEILEYRRKFLVREAERLLDVPEDSICPGCKNRALLNEHGICQDCTDIIVDNSGEENLSEIAEIFRETPEKEKRKMCFSLFDIAKYSYHWWISLLGIEIGDGEKYLLHIERDRGVWKFDFLYLRGLYRRWKHRKENE